MSCVGRTGFTFRTVGIARSGSSLQNAQGLTGAVAVDSDNTPIDLVEIIAASNQSYQLVPLRALANKRFSVGSFRLKPFPFYTQSLELGNDMSFFLKHLAQRIDVIVSQSRLLIGENFDELSGNRDFLSEDSLYSNFHCLSPRAGDRCGSNPRLMIEHGFHLQDFIRHAVWIDFIGTVVDGISNVFHTHRIDHWNLVERCLNLL